MITENEKRKAWKQVRKFWGFPKLNDPKYTTQGPMEKEIAAINMHSKQVMVNEKNLEEKVGSELIRPILGHEIGHYKLCPYSLRNFVRLVAHANSVMGNVKDAKIVENLYADLLINYHLHRRGERKIAKVYQKLSQNRPQSKLWDFYIETFANMINKRTGNSVLNEEERRNAKDLSEILKKNTYRSKNWPKSIKEFAKRIKEYYDEEKKLDPQKDGTNGNSGQNAKPSQQPGSMGQKYGQRQGAGKKPGQGQKPGSKQGRKPGHLPGSGQSGKTCSSVSGIGIGKSKGKQRKEQRSSKVNASSQNGQKAGHGDAQNQYDKNQRGIGDRQTSPLGNLPAIDHHDAKDFLPYDKNKVSPQQEKKYLEKELKGLGEELGPINYRTVLAGLGLGGGKDLTIQLYKDLADNYILTLPKIESHCSSIFKESPMKCELDQIQEADFDYSLSQNPIKAPNFLYRWKLAEGESGMLNNTNPDLLIVYDSSGSMPDPSTQMSFALLSAMIAKEAALESQNLVGVINFSGSYQTQDFTNSRQKLDDVLAHYWGGGTLLPGRKILDMVEKHNKKTHLLIITDTFIHDLTSNLDYLEEALKKGKAGGTIFIDYPEYPHNQEQKKALQKAGFDIMFTSTFNDLVDLTLKKTKEVYA